MTVTVVPALDCWGSWGGWTLLFLQVASQSQVLHQLVTGRSQQDLPRVVWQQVLPVRKGKVWKNQTSMDQNFNLKCDKEAIESSHQQWGWITNIFKYVWGRTKHSGVKTVWFPGIWSLTLDLGSCCKVADIFGKSFLLENIQVKDTGALLKAHTELHVDQKLILGWQVPDLKPVVNQLCNHILENKFYLQWLYFAIEWW